MGIDPTNARLSDLLLNPRETLDVELKSWLDLDVNEDKATLAKALLAIANHGGGFVLIGLTENQTDAAAVVSDGRPATLDRYSQDLVNGIVQSFADPPFHCAVHYVQSPKGELHPIIVVPGGHRVPIRAKRSGPSNQIVHQNAIYVRRPGPKSETPQNAQDWDELLARCLSARRDELLDRVRELLSGAVGTSLGLGNVPENAKLDAWVDDCVARWTALVDGLPTADPRRCPNGFYWFGYQLRGDLQKLTPQALLEILRSRITGHSGWPPFVVIGREPISPYMKDGALECWLGHEEASDAAHADFWRVSPDGFAFLIRGYSEDSQEVSTNKGASPGTLFDLTAPVWRAAEVLLHAGQLASHAAAANNAVAIAFRAHFDGLQGRKLVSLFSRRHVWDGRISHQDAITLSTLVDAQLVSSNLPEIVHPFLEPLYALFQFMQLPERLVQEEVSSLQSNRY